MYVLPLAISVENSRSHGQFHKQQNYHSRPEENTIPYFPMLSLPTNPLPIPNTVSTSTVPTATSSTKIKLTNERHSPLRNAERQPQFENQKIPPQSRNPAAQELRSEARVAAKPRIRRAFLTRTLSARIPAAHGYTQPERVQKSGVSSRVSVTEHAARLQCRSAASKKGSNRVAEGWASGGGGCGGGGRSSGT